MSRSSGERGAVAHAVVAGTARRMVPDLFEALDLVDGILHLSCFFFNGDVACGITVGTELCEGRRPGDGRGSSFLCGDKRRLWRLIMFRGRKVWLWRMERVLEKEDSRKPDSVEGMVAG